MSSTPTDAKERPKSQRRLRNYLLDAKFQLRFASYFVLLTLVISGLLGTFLFNAMGSMLELLDAAVEAREKANTVSRELARSVVNTEQERAKGSDDPALAKALEEKNKAINAAFAAEAERIATMQRDITEQQRSTFFTVVACLFFFTLLIALMAIIVTHRIVGPLVRIKRVVTEVTEGVISPPTSGLRPDDEMKEVFELVTKMVRALRTRAEADQKAVDAALAGDRVALETLKGELESRLTKRPGQGPSKAGA